MYLPEQNINSTNIDPPLWLKCLVIMGGWGVGVEPSSHDEHD